MLDGYPSITEGQFRDACEVFEKRSHDRLDGTSWHIVRWTGVELLIREQRTLSAKCAPMQDAVQMNGGPNDLAVEDIEEDGVVMVCSWLTLKLRASAHMMQLDRCERSDTSYVEVDFSITLSPTYRILCRSACPE